MRLSLPRLLCGSLLVSTLGVLAAMGGASPVLAADLRALPEGERPTDVRLRSLRTLNSEFPFQAVAGPEEWAARREALRRRVRVATGLWPWPERTPLRAVVHGRVDRPEYTVEKVFFESLPGHLVTGNLYRPRGGEGRRPAVLSPHGHETDGRFHDYGFERVREEIASGAERFEVGGRHYLQARAVQLARMGCVVFQYEHGRLRRQRPARASGSRGAGEHEHPGALGILQPPGRAAAAESHGAPELEFITCPGFSSLPPGRRPPPGRG